MHYHMQLMSLSLHTQRSQDYYFSYTSERDKGSISIVIERRLSKSSESCISNELKTRVRILKRINIITSNILIEYVRNNSQT